jgi:predicted metal-binding protein
MLSPRGTVDIFQELNEIEYKINALSHMIDISSFFDNNDVREMEDHLEENTAKIKEIQQQSKKSDKNIKPENLELYDNKFKRLIEEQIGLYQKYFDKKNFVDVRSLQIENTKLDDDGKVCCPTEQQVKGMIERKMEEMEKSLEEDDGFMTKMENKVSDKKNLRASMVNLKHFYRELFGIDLQNLEVNQEEKIEKNQEDKSNCVSININDEINNLDSQQEPDGNGKINNANLVESLKNEQNRQKKGIIIALILFPVVVALCIALPLSLT